MISNVDSNGYLIEASKDLSFIVDKPAGFTTLMMNPLNGTVGGKSIYQLSYNLAVPTDPSCKMIISAPVDQFNF